LIHFYKRIMSTSFGIHVGNTSACLAVSKDGKTDVVANPTGDRTTPAIVAFQDTEIIVGLAAKQGKIRNMSNTILNNKGLVVGKVEQELLDKSAVTITESNGQYTYEVDFKEKEYFVSPSAVLGHIYKYVHDIADTHCANISDSNCVLTVPLSYTEEQRNIVKNTADKAGFKVMQVISEPVAACLAYGLGQIEPSERYHCLVFRVGGLTMSVTMILVAGGCYTVLASKDFNIGGEQVTDVLVQYLGNEFKQKYKEDILKNKRGRAKLAAQAETVKHVLSTLDTAHCYVESLFDGMDFSSNVTRARFDNQLSKVLSDLMSPISALLTESNLLASDISKVILAGGSTKVTKIQSALSSMFPQAEMMSSLAPDEVIAIGAAVQASYITKETTKHVNEKLLAISKDIVAVVEGREEDVVVVVQDSTLPVKRSVPLTPLPDTDSITVMICWGERSSVLTSLSLSPISNKSKLSLSVHIHRDGSSHITLADKTSGSSSDCVLKAAGA